MDPLSVTASALTIIGAIDQSVKCIRKLQAIRKAPSELAQLLVEVSDLHQVLLLVAAVVSNEEASSSRQNGPHASKKEEHTLRRQVSADLERHSERAALTLDDLNRIVCDYSSRIERGKSAAGGISWIQSGRRKACNLREKLRDTRLNIVTTLGVNSRYVGLELCRYDQEVLMITFDTASA